MFCILMLIEPAKTWSNNGYDWLDLWYWYRYDAPGAPSWACPHCGSKKNEILWPNGSNGKEKRKVRIHALNKCYSCMRQFSYVTGTRFERTKICMWKWMKCIYLVEKYNLTIYDLCECLGVAYKVAWKMKKVANQAIEENDLLGWHG